MPLYYHHIHGLEVLMGVLATGEDALLGGKRFDISLPEASPLGVVRAMGQQLQCFVLSCTC
jgi:hypothetical protein